MPLSVRTFAARHSQQEGVLLRASGRHAAPSSPAGLTGAGTEGRSAGDSQCRRHYLLGWVGPITLPGTFCNFEAAKKV